MSKTMTQTHKNLIEMAQSIHVKDTFTLQINNQFLNHNFYMIKECLLKVQQLQTDLNKEKNGNQQLLKRFQQLSSQVKQNQKMTISQDFKIKELQNNIGDDFMKKLYDLETRIKNTFDFDQTVRRLGNMNKFVTTDKFQEQKNRLNLIDQSMEKLKSDMKRYVQNSQLNIYKQQVQKQLQQINTKIDGLNLGAQTFDTKIQEIGVKCQGAVNDVKQTNLMIKQINFAQLQEKIKKFKEDTDIKVGQLSLKMKKKVGTNDLSELEKGIIEKLDRFFLISQKGKASVNQTKEALLYLEKRVNEIYEIFISKEEDEDKDALFSTKKVQCASCTKDMGKFEGKLGQFRPWAVFPCKQLEPQKTGGYGYLSYIDKLTSRRGSSSIDDNNLQRLSKTFYNQKVDEQSPNKLNTTRTTNFISNYGSQEKNIISLKDQYFKDLKIADKNQKNGTKFFRVKKDIVKPSTAMQTTKQRAKQV